MTIHGLNNTVRTDMRSPLVSVVIPVYNAASFVCQAVQSSLGQTYGNREIIVVDDGSTDGTREALSEFHGRFTYLYQKNSGVAAARNTGIRAAKGDLVCFLDADDLWAANAVELRLEFLQRHREIGLLSCRAEKFIDDDSAHIPFTPKEPRDGGAQTFPAPEGFGALVKSNFIVTSTVMMRRECLDKAGLFDVSFISAEDRDLWLRIAAHFTIAYLPWLLCKKRLHAHNISADKERMMYTRIKVLEKNRSLFPGLVSFSVWNKQLAKLYLKAGYLSLLNDRREKAREAALSSLQNRATAKAAMLLAATSLGQAAIRILLRTSKQVRNLKRTSPIAPLARRDGAGS
jgi:glycosyltransferase involved in cell wall biosynthesis